MKRLLVGLTGGIGTGKSTALALFGRCGARTISCDAIAHQLLRRGRAGYGPVLRRFGPGLLGRGGELDRAALARRVFRSASERKALERLLWPRVLSELRRRAAGRKRGVVVVDVPLLFEARAEGDFDVSVVVTAPRARRLVRLRRRSMPRPEALRRIAAQMPLADKIRRADLVLDNGDGIRRLKADVRRLYRAFALIAGAS